MDRNRAVVIKIEDDAAASGDSFHPVFSETMADNARNGAYVNMRIPPALTRYRGRAGLAQKWPPSYDATVDDQFVPSTGEAKVNDVGSSYEFAFANVPLANECLARESGQFGRLTNCFHLSSACG